MTGRQRINSYPSKLNFGFYQVSGDAGKAAGCNKNEVLLFGIGKNGEVVSQTCSEPQPDLPVMNSKYSTESAHIDPNSAKPVQICEQIIDETTGKPFLDINTCQLVPDKKTKKQVIDIYTCKPVVYKGSCIPVFDEKTGKPIIGYESPIGSTFYSNTKIDGENKIAEISMRYPKVGEGQNEILTNVRFSPSQRDVDRTCGRDPKKNHYPDKPNPKPKPDSSKPNPYLSES